ncbi:hypothetical protein Cni_G22317 [Canna indica]|uniref:Uncharacterized protein n=1 Tax=Canna indica TaxID=4628 RepID=A0AAQ3KXR4_9LILI|nr:hypothetical protein Cni_G22317 [Canna indica]
MGSTSLANSGRFQTTKLAFVELHETMEFVMGSSTMSYLVKNGGMGLEHPRALSTLSFQRTRPTPPIKIRANYAQS